VEGSRAKQGTTSTACLRGVRLGADEAERVKVSPLILFTATGFQEIHADAI
jgi:hypothetical protein